MGIKKSNDQPTLAYSLFCVGRDIVAYYFYGADTFLQWNKFYLPRKKHTHQHKRDKLFLWME